MGDDARTIHERITAAVRRRESGDVLGAREALEAARPAVEQGSGFDRLFFAHSFADVQEDPVQELRWDLAALAAMDHLSEEEVANEGVPGGRAGLLPSLHLNLADVYRHLGNDREAQRHCEAGANHLGALDEGRYGDAIREAFKRFAEA